MLITLSQWPEETESITQIIGFMASGLVGEPSSDDRAITEALPADMVLDIMAELEEEIAPLFKEVNIDELTIMLLPEHFGFGGSDAVEK